MPVRSFPSGLSRIYCGSILDPLHLLRIYLGSTTDLHFLPLTRTTCGPDSHGEHWQNAFVYKTNKTRSTAQSENSLGRFCDHFVYPNRSSVEVVRGECGPNVLGLLETGDTAGEAVVGHQSVRAQAISCLRLCHTIISASGYMRPVLPSKSSTHTHIIAGCGTVTPTSVTS